MNLTMRGLHVSMMNNFFLVSKGFQKNLGKKLRKKSKNVVTSSTPGGGVVRGVWDFPELSSHILFESFPETETNTKTNTYTDEQQFSRNMMFLYF